MAMPILNTLEEKIDPQLAALLVIDMFLPGRRLETHRRSSHAAATAA